MEYDQRLFGRIDRFVKMKILGEEYEVPDRLELLRVFQFLDFEIDYSKLCWNGSCNRCLVDVDGKTPKKATLCCRLRSSEGMEVTRLPGTIKPAAPKKKVESAS